MITPKSVAFTVVLSRQKRLQKGLGLATVTLRCRLDIQREAANRQVDMYACASEKGQDSVHAHRRRTEDGNVVVVRPGQLTLAADRKYNNIESNCPGNTYL